MPRTRSVLSVPGSRPDMIEKALASAADAVFIDLEDAVAPAAKERARAATIDAIRDLDWRGRRRMLRVNGIDSAHFYRDIIDVLEATGDLVDEIVLPKVNRPEDVAFADTLLRQVELHLGRVVPVVLQAQIETAAGVTGCEAIARSSSRLSALVFGPGDLAASAGVPASAIGTQDGWDVAYGAHRWHYVMCRILFAARAAGISAIDGPYAAFRDPSGLRRSCVAARALGFDAKWCIHPAQAEIVNEVFTPSEAELAHARHIVEIYEAALSVGGGALAEDSQMLDAASLRMAKRTLGVID